MKYKFPLAIFVSVLSALVFFSLFQSLHMSHLFRLETFPIALLPPEDTRSEAVINFRLNDPLQSELPQPELLDYVAEIAERDGVSVILSGSELNERGITRINFILGEDFILDSLIGDTLPWSDPNESRYMAVGHPENPIHLLGSNYRETDLVLRPWNQIQENFSAPLGIYSVLIYTSGEPSKYLEDSKLYSFNDQSIREEAYINRAEDMLHVKQGDFYSSRSSWITIAMIGLLIVFVYFLFVSDHAKDIAVRRLNGQSNLRILYELFSSFNVVLLAAWIAPMVILSIIFGTGWNPLAFSFYLQLMIADLLFLSALILATLIALLYIRRTGFWALKQSGKPSATSNTMYVVKLVFLIFCIAFISTFGQNIRGYREIKKYVDMYANKPIYEVMLASGAEKHGIDYEMLREAIADYAMYFQTIQVVDMKNLIIGEAPSMLHQTVLADHRLTDYADIILSDDSIFRPESGKRYLLYPPGTDIHSYFEIPGLNQSPEGVEFIEIRADQNLMLPHEFGGVYNNYAGFSFFLAENIKSIKYQNYLIDRRVHPWQEVSDYLEANGIPRWAVYPLYKNQGGQVEEMQFTIHMDERNMAIAGIGLIIAMVITYSFTRIYIDDHRKRLAIAYLFGESFFSRYGYLLVTWLLIYGSLALFFIVFRHMAIALLQLNYSPNMMPRFNYDLMNILRLILAFFVGEGLLSLYFIHRLEIRVVRALKGGEI